MVVGVLVLVGMLDDRDVGVGEGVMESKVIVGVLIANAPIPCSIGVAPI